MRYYYGMLTFLVAFSFCADADAQLFRWGRKPAQTCTPVSRCVPRTTAGSQVTHQSHTQPQNFQSTEIVETSGITSSWGIEGGRGMLIVDSPLDSVFADEVVLVDHQEPHNVDDGVYPPPSIQGNIHDGAYVVEITPVNGVFQDQLERPGTVSKPNQELSQPVPTETDQAETDPPVPVAVPVVEPPDEEEFFGAVTDVELASPAESNRERTGESQLVEVSSTGDEAAQTVLAPTDALDADPTAPGPTLLPSESKDPATSIME